MYVLSVIGCSCLCHLCFYAPGSKQVSPGKGRFHSWCNSCTDSPEYFSLQRYSALSRWMNYCLIFLFIFLKLYFWISDGTIKKGCRRSVCWPGRWKYLFITVETLTTNSDKNKTKKLTEKINNINHDKNMTLENTLSFCFTHWEVFVDSSS